MSKAGLAVCWLVLGLGGGCRQQQPAQPAPSPAPAVVAQQDVDAGSKPANATPPEPKPPEPKPPEPKPPEPKPPEPKPPEPTENAPARPLPQASYLKPRPVQSVQSFVREQAQQEGWKLSQEDLEGYWRPVTTLKDDNLGRFVIGLLVNDASPRGGIQYFVLMREFKGRWMTYGPLIDQKPPTPDYMHEILSPKMTFRSVEGYSGKMLWVQLQDKLKTRLDSSGEKLDVNTILLDYGILVDSDGGSTTAFISLPERITHQVGDAEPVETRLVVTVPVAERFEVTAGPEGANADQRAWIGTHRIGK